CGGFSLPVDQGDTDTLARQGVGLEERAQITLPLLPPMMHDHPPRPKFQQVEFASPDDEPDHPLRVGGVERHQPLTAPFEDRLPCVFQRPANGWLSARKTDPPVSPRSASKMDPPQPLPFYWKFHNLELLVNGGKDADGGRLRPDSPRLPRRHEY